MHSGTPIPRFGIRFEQKFVQTITKFQNGVPKQHFQKNVAFLLLFFIFSSLGLYGIILYGVDLWSLDRFLILRNSPICMQHRHRKLGILQIWKVWFTWRINLMRNGSSNFFMFWKVNLHEGIKFLLLVYRVVYFIAGKIQIDCLVFYDHTLHFKFLKVNCWLHLFFNENVRDFISF